MTVETRYGLHSAGTANSDSSERVVDIGGSYIFYADGVFGGATCALFIKGGGHTNYNSAASTSYTVSGGDSEIDIAVGDTVKSTISGATGTTSITSSLNRVR